MCSTRSSTGRPISLARVGENACLVMYGCSEFCFFQNQKISSKSNTTHSTHLLKYNKETTCSEMYFIFSLSAGTATRSSITPFWHFFQKFPEKQTWYGKNLQASLHLKHLKQLYILLICFTTGSRKIKVRTFICWIKTKRSKWHKKKYRRHGMTNNIVQTFHLMPVGVSRL